MAVKIIMPKSGVTMTEGMIVKWRKKEGDRVKEGEVVVEIMTDKVTYEVEAPADGVIGKIYYKEGSMVPVYETIALVTGEEGKAAKIEEEEKNAGRPAEPIKISPLARKIALAKGIDISEVTGTGPGGRIVEKDVKVFLEKQAQPAPPPHLKEERFPFTGRRKMIAENLRRSREMTAPVTSTTEVDLTELLSLREKIKDLWLQEYSIKPTVNAFFARALAKALRKHPFINATLENNEVIVKHYVNLGLAMSAEEGLVVPVIQGADQLSLLEIAQKIEELQQKVKNNELRPEDLSGGTFTFTNVGPFDVYIFTPVIVYPQAGILGFGKAREELAMLNGEVVVRQKAFLSLTYDHCLIDGAPAAEFRKTVKKYLEKPLLLL